MEKMFALLDEEPDVADAPNAPALDARAGSVAFREVAFAHDGRTAGLNGVSFDIPAGTTTAIVGPSGAGKSTILSLLFRFYDPVAGAVLIDGQDIKSVTQKSLREALGLVPQDVVLFNDTIRYNIAYGRPEATQAELEAAAARAQLLEFIERLPEGWDTKVGERGLKLSGGEKQRVGIARVVLKDPKILVLDEATSSLDSRTEQEVQAALENAARGRTTLVVAHRLSTIAGADQILVLKDGRIVERGRHADLIARDGEYAELWRRQAEEPAGEAAVA
jgi:ATP-binding cassette subfamily B protein